MSAESVLWSLVAHTDGHQLVIDWNDGSRIERSWFPVHEHDRFVSMLRSLADYEPRVGIASRVDKHRDAVTCSPLLWCRVETGPSVSLLSRFRPAPTVVFQEGGTVRQTACWWLTKAVPVTADPSGKGLELANKRLARVLKGKAMCGEPEWLIPWHKIGMVVADPSRRYSARDVVGKLADPPARKWGPS